MKILYGAGLVLLSACSSSSAQQSAKNPAPTDVVAAVGSTPITLAEVDDRAMRQPAGNFGNVRLSQAIYDARRGAIDDMVDEILLDQEAKGRGMGRAALEQQEIASKVGSISDDEISSWYEQNKARVQGAALPQVHDAIRQYLTRERTAEVRGRYLDQLKAKSNIRIMLEPPRQMVAAANGPSKGPVNAPVEMIEFSDFQCPFCLRAHPIVAQVLNTYGDRIHFVYRHYPLNIHPDARPAAEASQCADEQGQFWPYYEALFGDASHLTDADLKQRAVRLGMNTTQFNACVDLHKYQAEIEADMHAGDEAGVSGTPAFFINGRMLTGAQPFDIFKRVIDEELAQKKSR